MERCCNKVFGGELPCDQPNQNSEQYFISTLQRKFKVAKPT